ncbi:ROK family transcriptional regulator [Anditalea andensis]|uniref:ROK family transcriptional regulator n=1 Tax=Anditalea andensis TaxID=1048983 RepID=A0A074KPH4_9BACT|nr:ROK family transcriptional regulator [Anditalea andensis]
MNLEKIRETAQFELPVKRTQAGPRYDIYPIHPIGADLIHVGYDSLAKELAAFDCVKIEGYGGIIFEDLKERLQAAFLRLHRNPIWVNVQDSMKAEVKIDEMVAPFLGGDDPVFGRLADIDLEDYFDLDKLEALTPTDYNETVVFYGTGAHLVPLGGKLVYFDISKNEIQFRSRAGSVTNLGATRPSPPKDMYKRFYFVDWVVLNKYKNRIKNEIDYLVDGQRSHEITWVQGNIWRSCINTITTAPIRVRPWFEPGAWGGQWIKENIKALNQEVENYAWSFELILPENGIIIESSDIMLEFSFDFLMYHSGENILGKDFDTFGFEFPIRFDFLDTFDGGNLSIQCHPQTDYIQKHFGENITQEETYYILDRKDDALVYLGFQEGVKPEAFQEALEKSFKNSEEIDITQYVQSFRSMKHGLYLIPPGTIHSSGKDNLVLEISSTPYIYTFKMYDWLRVDLDGNPRPINIQRGMDNLVFEHAGLSVEEKLISKPQLIEENTECQLEHLPTHEKHLYDVHRFVINTKVTVKTNGKAHVLSLVEGSKLEINSNGQSFTFHYAESFIIPAAAEEYTITNSSDQPIMVIKAFIK